MKRITLFSIILMSWKFTLNTLVGTLVMTFNNTFLKGGLCVYMPVLNRRWGGDGYGDLVGMCIVGWKVGGRMHYNGRVE